MDDDPRPGTGKWFEELVVGATVRHATRRTVTETDNVLFTTMTMNPAAIHPDADYAATTEFGRPLFNSMFTAALVVGLSVPELTSGTIIAQLGLSEVRFPAPVFAGDTIHVESEVTASRESKSRPNAGLVEFEHRGFNQRNELVCQLRRTALMYKEPARAATHQSACELGTGSTVERIVANAIRQLRARVPRRSTSVGRSLRPAGLATDRRSEPRR